MVGGIFGIPIMSEEELKTIYSKEIQKRDYELLQLSKHIEEFRNKYPETENMRLLETTLETQAEVTREIYGGV
jgi:hypothetical protein